MANPSIQIGNSNWAIKEDDLLGYSTVGTNYLPKPITMTRASAGTRVNPQGLVETVELLGSEEITNGDFNISGTLVGNSYTLGWRSGDIGLTISNGVLNLYNNGSGFVGRAYATNGIDSYSNLLIIGKTYKISYEVTENIANSTLYAYLGSFIAVDKTVGIHTTYITATQHFFLFRNGSSNTTIKIDNVSVKEVTRDNLARVDYTDGTGSLLVEPMRTNLVTYSEDFSNAYFQKIRSTISTDQIVSPDGILSGDKFIEDSALGTKLLWTQDEVISIGDKITWSVFAKKGEREWIMLRDTQAGNFTVFFDLENGVIGTSSGVDSSKIEDYGSGWYRCSITYTSTTTTARGRLYLADANSGESYQGNGTSGLYIWGAQLEEGSYPTSYIPTDGGTVTRVQDQYKKTGISNLINSTEGVLFIEMAAFSESNLNSYITIGQNTSNGILGISFYTGSNNILLDHWEGASETYHIESISDVTEFNKIAICYDGTSIKGYINGSPVWNTTVTAWSSNALSELNFAFGNSGTNKFLGKVKQLQIYKTALKDEQLKTLTT